MFGRRIAEMRSLTSIRGFPGTSLRGDDGRLPEPGNVPSFPNEMLVLLLVFVLAGIAKLFDFNPTDDITHWFNQLVRFLGRL
jgi:hypothetical protein